jgi:uncharacterized protein involved in oxidation of intracellular sulfur
MPKTLFILNDPPYGTERSYNALRLAGSLSRRDREEVNVFLIGDAASCAKKDQKVPQGYYNAEVMVPRVDERVLRPLALAAPALQAPERVPATGRRASPIDGDSAAHDMARARESPPRGSRFTRSRVSSRHGHAGRSQSVRVRGTCHSAMDALVGAVPAI